MALNRKQKGNLAEDLAVAFLEDRGFRVLSRNYRCALGEIDLVCRDRESIVFVEVKSRFGSGFGCPQEMVSRPKQKRLTRLARWYLKTNRLDGQPARFDVVAILWLDAKPQLSWIPNAFEAAD